MSTPATATSSSPLQDGEGELFPAEEEEPLESEVPTLATAAPSAEIRAIFDTILASDRENPWPIAELADTKEDAEAESLAEIDEADLEEAQAISVAEKLLALPREELPAGESIAPADYPEQSALEASDAMSELLFMDMLGDAEAAEVEGMVVTEAKTDPAVAVIAEAADTGEQLEESEEAEAEQEETKEMQETAVTTAQPSNSLPGWLREEDSDNDPVGIDAVTSTSFDRAETSEVEDSIAMARSLSSQRYGETGKAQVAAFAGAGAAFAPVVEQPWQPSGTENSSAATPVLGRAKAVAENNTSRRGKVVLVVIAIGLAILALAYIFNVSVAREATRGVSGVIGEILALAGQK